MFGNQENVWNHFLDLMRFTRNIAIATNVERNDDETAEEPIDVEAEEDLICGYVTSSCFLGFFMFVCLCFSHHLCHLKLPFFNLFFLGLCLLKIKDPI